MTGVGIVLLFCLLASATAGLAQQYTLVSANDQVKAMGRGINILGYDPIWEAHRYIRFKVRHFELLKSAGFKTVRLNLFAFRHMDKDNRLDPEWLKTLDDVIDHALALGLVVVIDEHDDDCDTDVMSCRSKLIAFWEQISERYKEKPSTVLFEILNEPGGTVTPKIWNDLLGECLKVIRRTNLTRNVIVGPAGGYRYEHLADLNLPEADRNIIVTIHYYRPFDFTHQKAPWDLRLRLLPARAWGSDKDWHELNFNFGNIERWSEANGRPIFLGEFGVYDAADIKERAHYTSALARAAEKNGWAWAYWQFDPDFALYNIEKDTWVKPILEALVPEQP
jgi:endoglucanase